MRSRTHIASASVLGVLLMAAPMLPQAAGVSEGADGLAGNGAEPRADGAFVALSAGDRVIARALHAAQLQAAAPGDRMPLETIAGMRRDGSSWLEVFSVMKARDLVAERNLGRLIAKQSRRGGQGEALVLSQPPAEERTDYVEAGIDAPATDAGSDQTPAAASPSSDGAEMKRKTPRMD